MNRWTEALQVIGLFVFYVGMVAVMYAAIVVAGSMTGAL